MVLMIIFFSAYLISTALFNQTFNIYIDFKKANIAWSNLKLKPIKYNMYSVHEIEYDIIELIFLLHKYLDVF